MNASSWVDIKQRLKKTEAFSRLLGVLTGGGGTTVSGLVGASRSLLVSALHEDNPSPIFILGFSEAVGSWKITCIRQRSLRISLAGRVAMSVPSNRI